MAGVKVTLKARRIARAHYQSYKDNNMIYGLPIADRPGRMREVGGMRKAERDRRLEW